MYNCGKSCVNLAHKWNTWSIVAGGNEGHPSMQLTTSPPHVPFTKRASVCTKLQMLSAGCTVWSFYRPYGGLISKVLVGKHCIKAKRRVTLIWQINLCSVNWVSSNCQNISLSQHVSWKLRIIRRQNLIDVCKTW